MAFADENCVQCGRQLANTKYSVTEKYTGRVLPLCPICYLGEEEGGQSKYWETSQAPKPDGFQYPDDTTLYKERWDGKTKKWVLKSDAELTAEVEARKKKDG
jgi:hypothetical protein